MKIVFVLTYFDPNKGKMLPFYYLAKGLSILGHEVKIYYSSKIRGITNFYSGERKIISEGVPAYFFKIGRTPFSYSPRLFKKILQTDFDVIHVWEYATLNSIMAIIVGFIKNKPCFVTTPLYLPLWNRKWKKIVSIFCHLFIPIINPFISKLFCESRSAFRTHISLGFPRKKIYIIPNSTDMEEFKPYKRDKLFRKKIGLHQSDKVILIVSKLYETKGISCLLKAWRMIEESRSNSIAKLVILGDGNPYYEKLVDKFKLVNVIFLKKFIYHNDMPKLYSIADIFVLLSNYEQSPNVLLEAASCGIPIVATNVGGIIDIVIDGETGLLVNPDSPKDAAIALLNLIENDELRYRLGLFARKFALKNLGNIKISKKVERIYNNVLKIKS